MSMTYTKASFLLIAASIPSAFVVGGLWESSIASFSVMATLYTAALAAYAKSKGRAFAWSLWGVFPVIGWIALGRLRDHTRTRGVAPDGATV